MTFTEQLRQILCDHPEGVTPQQVREIIKIHYPDFYGTEAHRRNVERSHYTDLDHALLAQIYLAARNASDIFCDKSQKPMRLILISSENNDGASSVEELELENLDKLEEGRGTLYILGTNLFTKDGLEIIKIGITTGSVEDRVRQLYTTSAPYRFRIITQIETKNYAELEQAVHRMLDPYRINRSREYFTDDCIAFVNRLVDMHEEIVRTATNKDRPLP